MALLGLVAPLSLAVLPTENARIETVIGRVAGVLRAILVDDGVGKFLVGDPLDPRAETLRVSLLSMAHSCKEVETRNPNRLEKAGLAFTAWQDLLIGKTGALPTSKEEWTPEQADVVREGEEAEALLLKTVREKVEVSASTLSQPVPGSTVPVCPLFPTASSPAAQSHAARSPLALCSPWFADPCERCRGSSKQCTTATREGVVARQHHYLRLRRRLPEGRARPEMGPSPRPRPAERGGHRAP